MAASTNLTVNLPAETQAQLAKLSRHTRRDQQAIGADAIADYVVRELAIVEAIERGKADVRAGRIVPHADVVVAADEIIERARSRV